MTSPVYNVCANLGCSAPLLEQKSSALTQSKPYSKEQSCKVMFRC